MAKQTQRGDRTIKVAVPGLPPGETLRVTLPPEYANSTLAPHIDAAVDELRETLGGRDTSYKDFADNSAAALAIMQACGLEASNTDAFPTSYHLNAMTQIAAKLSRLAGNPTHEDSWLDIAGYAILALACTRRDAA